MAGLWLAARPLAFQEQKRSKLGALCLALVSSTQACFAGLAPGSGKAWPPMLQARPASKRWWMKRAQAALMLAQQGHAKGATSQFGGLVQKRYELSRCNSCQLKSFVQT